ncbi:VOC family protein [Thioclava sp. FR2]|uniref:VOC family protein n=1 Tax=Thioclava sp. FR2 TaxID=3445780 RepID=UPI003EB6DBE6
MTLRLDHLAVSALTLDEGAEHVEAVLGLPLAAGGKHPHMATHNRLLGLGDLYLEVIAADPEAPKPAWPRWFDLDRFSGLPRLTNWICACDDLELALSAAPDGTGEPVDLQRGDLRWRMAVPGNGILPFGGGFPALIQWQGAHPAPRLPDVGARLKILEIVNPAADEMRHFLNLKDERVRIVQGDAIALRAEITTPHGVRVLE